MSKIEQRTQPKERPDTWGPSHSHLKAWRGHVVSVADRVSGVFFTAAHGSSAQINAVPEVWLKDANGEELRFSSHLLTSCRVGHELVIVGDVSHDSLLGMRNLSTKETWYTRELESLKIGAVQVLISITLGILFSGLTWLFAFAIFGEAWSRDSWWERTAPQLMSYAGLGLAVAILEIWRRNHNRRKENLRQAVGTAIEAASR